MTADRDTLAALILPHLDKYACPPGTIGRQWVERQATEIADVILTAGWVRDDRQS